MLLPTRDHRGARISGTDALTPTPVRAHATRTDSGRPSSSIRFRARAAMATSVARRAVRARAQRVADHPLVAGHRRLGQSATIVAGRLLPAHAAVLGDGPEVPVALRRRGLGRPARHRVPARRHDDRRLGVALGDRAVHVLPVVGAVAGERGDRAVHLVEQRARPGSRRRPRWSVSSTASIRPVSASTPEVQLAPGPAGPGAVLLDQPLAGPAQLQARAVHQQVQRPAAPERGRGTSSVAARRLTGWCGRARPGRARAGGGSSRSGPRSGAGRGGTRPAASARSGSPAASTRAARPGSCAAPRARPRPPRP